MSGKPNGSVNLILRILRRARRDLFLISRVLGGYTHDLEIQISLVNSGEI